MSNEEEIVVESVIQRPDTVQDVNTNQPDQAANIKRKRASIDGDEEKRRGRRLFGTLLGTLGGLKQDADSPRAKERAAKQAELEQRQKERLQKTADEIAKAEAAELAELRRQQVEQDEVFIAKQAEAQQRQKELLAHHLICAPAGEIPLLYLPWKLNKEQQDKLDEQIRNCQAASPSKDTLMHDGV